MLVDNQTIAEVEQRARIFYIDRDHARHWNTHRRGDEKRLLTGWMWVDRKNPNNTRRCMKTRTAALIDAWYALVQHTAVPRIEPPAKLRVVHDGAARKVA